MTEAPPAGKRGYEALFRQRRAHSHHADDRCAAGVHRLYGTIDQQGQTRLSAIVWNRKAIQFWGRRSAFPLAFGLVACCFAAARDRLWTKPSSMPLTVAAHPVFRPHGGGLCRGGADPSGGWSDAPGKGQHVRQIWFYIMSGGVRLKLLMVEISRLLL